MIRKYSYFIDVVSDLKPHKPERLPELIDDIENNFGFNINREALESYNKIVFQANQEEMDVFNEQYKNVLKHPITKEVSETNEVNYYINCIASSSEYDNIAFNDDVFKKCFNYEDPKQKY